MHIKQTWHNKYAQKALNSDCVMCHWFFCHYRNPKPPATACVKLSAKKATNSVLVKPHHFICCDRNSILGNAPNGELQAKKGANSDPINVAVLSAAIEILALRGGESWVAQYFQGMYRAKSDFRGEKLLVHKLVIPRSRICCGWIWGYSTVFIFLLLCQSL